MAVRKILTIPDSILRQKSLPVDKVNRDYIIKKDSPYGKGDTAKRVKQILYDNGNSQLLQKS